MCGTILDACTGEWRRRRYNRITRYVGNRTIITFIKGQRIQVWTHVTKLKQPVRATLKEKDNEADPEKYGWIK